MRSQSIYVGLDIGGAHVKAVGIDQYKKINLIFYEKCPIWKDFFLKKTLHKLLKYLDSAKQLLVLRLQQNYLIVL